MSRYLVISDIHSNLEALDAVLRASSKQNCDGVLVLGDLVGYGASPNEVVKRIRELNPAALVRGNHDKVASGLETAEDFNPMARLAVDWTRHALTEETLEYLSALPAGPRLVADRIEVCHGSPVDEDLYVMADVDAIRSIEAARRSLCLFGHTHVALCARLDDNRRLEIETPQGHPEFETGLAPSAKYLINPGSVGQPRDGDSRAAYAIADLDSDVVTLYRVAYPIETAQKKIVDAGLPPMLAYRLGMGR
ncbi:MAG TPA: metallophosphoesterase family protein [Vicinamibacterales bacterium]|jgi:predicted phosphodiesterase|nr:metallophosphoesterase family protein [Vicinamibacterales bacterium]